MALDIGDLETHTAHVAFIVAEPNSLLIRNACAICSLAVASHFGHSARTDFTWEHIRFCRRFFCSRVDHSLHQAGPFSWRVLGDSAHSFSSPALSSGTGRVVRGCTDTALGRHANLLSFFGPLWEDRIVVLLGIPPVCAAAFVSQILDCSTVHHLSDSARTGNLFVTLIRGGSCNSQILGSRHNPSIEQSHHASSGARRAARTCLSLDDSLSPLSHSLHRLGIAQTWPLALAFDFHALAFCRHFYVEVLAFSQSVSLAPQWW